MVVLADGSGYEAQIKCSDEDSDLAVLKINKSGLQVADFGNEEDITIGRTVIAIGTPISFSLRNSASIGIISGINRSVSSLYRLIQTDAAINPGNSGGPLVNLDGKVLGINTSKYIGLGAEGLGFAIPVGTVKYVVDEFDKHNAVNRPFLGTTFEEGWAARVGLPTNSGLIIRGIEANSPAEQYGLKVDDILIAINDNRVNTVVDFNEEMKKYSPQSNATLKINRQGIIENVKIVFGKK